MNLDNQMEVQMNSFKNYLTTTGMLIYIVLVIVKNYTTEKSLFWIPLFLSVLNLFGGVYLAFKIYNPNNSIQLKYPFGTLIMSLFGLIVSIYFISKH